MFVGALVGKKLLASLNQRLFENLALGLSALAAVDLIFRWSTFLATAFRSGP